VSRALQFLLWQDQGTGDEAADRFRFGIDDVFVITGRGTVVAGFIEHVAVRAGDRLRLIRSNGTEGPAVACCSVEFVDRPGPIRA
jgi:translation elongation factor EF-Tu-like GTPase